MDSFLNLTAENLYNRFGDRLPEIAVIFPNNRAKLFFCEHLYKIAGKPVWSPSFITISDLFGEQSGLRKTDQLTLISYLYGVYISISGKDESFDEFYLWGELLLSDFDDVDKNLADTVQLFRNIREQAAYTDTLEHLTEDQVESIRHFFINFSPERKTELKERFIENWNILLNVYDAFKERLLQKKIAYEGMLYRNVVEKIKDEGVDEFRHEKYAFVGFNVLNACEKSLFKSLHKAGKALFYWDYDEFYINRPEHEAGRFMRQNLEMFPNELDKSCFNNFRNIHKNINFIESSTGNAEARYLPDWIASLRASGIDFKPEETAVVLCDEGLLLPVLHSIPESVEELNVTMSFPLTQTPVCNLVTRICQMHVNSLTTGTNGRFNYRYVLPVLQQPLFRAASENAEIIENKIRNGNIFRPDNSLFQTDEFLKAAFSPVSDSKSLSELLMNVLSLLATSSDKAANSENENDGQQSVETGHKSDIKNNDPLFQESVFRCYTLVKRLNDLIANDIVDISPNVFQSLLQKIMSVTGIPFSGEPARGMQIMGMLETRNLDFRNVLIISANEGVIPKKGGEMSFIPYNLRKGFGLTTSDHKDSVFAYYFFRILQRAENISLVYNTSTDGMNSGEMSRFMLQLLVDSPYRVKRYNLCSDMSLNSPREISIDKTPEIMELLISKYNAKNADDARILTPTALNSFIDCSLKFYYRYIAGIKEKDEISDDIDGAMLGTLFHHAAEYIYTDILLRKSGQECNPAITEQFISNGQITKGLKNGSISGIIVSEDIEPWLKGIRRIEDIADIVFRTDFFMLPAEGDKAPEYSGEQLIKRKLLVGFLKALLNYDNTQAPFEIAAMEESVWESIDMPTPEGKLRLRLGGKIDRMDIKDGKLRIIDYKTGGEPVKPTSAEELFIPRKDRGSYIFQIFLYSSILQRKNPDITLEPLLLYINKAASKNYSPSIFIGHSRPKREIKDYKPFEPEFMKSLSDLLSDLFDKEIPFRQTEITSLCEYCAYNSICRRK